MQISFVYICHMKFSKKNIVFGIVFLLSIVLSYTYYSHYNEISFSVELTSENNLKSDSVFSDSISHEDHFANTQSTFIFSRNNIQKNVCFKPLLVIQPSFSIWQPPKIS